MSKIFTILCIGLASLAIGCADQQPVDQTAQTPIQWGSPAGGLQVGIAAEVAAAAPGRPQGSFAPLESVRIYLRNNGQGDLSVVDPTITGGTSSQPAVVSLFAGPARTPVLVQTRSSPGRVMQLTPSQSMSFSLPVAPGTTGSLIAQYENADAQIIVGASDGSHPPPTASGVWTGVARSGELPLNNNSY